MSRKGGRTLLEVTLTERRDFPDSVGTPTWTRDGLRISGDRYGRHEVYVGLAAHTAIIGSSATAVLERLGSHRVLTPDWRALSHVVLDGQAPFPRTVFTDVHALTIGDQMTIGQDGTTTHTVDFPYLESLSRADSVPSSDCLLQLLSASSSSLLPTGSRPLLMLSSGKDSTALALAMKEAGVADVLATTYVSEFASEDVVAAQTCRKLGIRYSVCDLRSATNVPASLIRFFRESPLPSGDLAQIPYVIAVSTAASQGRTHVVDGTGNDSTFGYLPRRRDDLAFRWTIGRFRWSGILARLVPSYSPLQYFMRSPIATFWPGLRVPARVFSLLAPRAVQTAPHWSSESRRRARATQLDQRAELRGRHFEIGSQKLKATLAANAAGVIAVFPYQDRAVVDYYFNLPRPWRHSGRQNKVLLRSLLRERLSYDAAAVGKVPFTFDGARFLDQYRGFVLETLRSSDLFAKPALERYLSRYDFLLTRRFGWHQIVGLFQLAGWWRFSKFSPARAGTLSAS